MWKGSGAEPAALQFFHTGRHKKTAENSGF
jgi:hypothetical protein